MDFIVLFVAFPLLPLMFFLIFNCVSLINICLIAFLIELILYGTLLSSWAWVATSFLIFWKFSSINSSNIFSDLSVFFLFFFFLLLLLSHQVVSNSLPSHGLQCVRLPCPSPTHGACRNSYPLNWLCYPTTSSSVTLFCLQSFPPSRSFQMS